MIYMVPYKSVAIGVFNPSNHVFCTIDIPAVVGKPYWPYGGGVLAVNGLIIFSPIQADNIGLFNPATGFFSTIDISESTRDFSGWKFSGSVVAPNGDIFFLPAYPNNKIGKLKLGSKQPLYEVSGGVPESWNALLSPYFNKF